MPAFRLGRRAAIAGLAAAPLARPAIAQGYPSRTVTLVVGFGAGGATDLGARLLANHGARHLGQTIVVENRVGASGVVGTEHVRRARADGYTMLMSRGAPATISPALEPRTTPYKWDEFSIVGLSDVNALCVCVKADAPWRTAADLFAAIRARPGQLNYSSSGPLSLIGLASKMFLWAGGLPVDSAVEIPFRSGAETLTAVIGGQVQFASFNMSEAAPGLSAGTMRAIMVTVPDKYPGVAGVQTAKEAGMPVLENLVGWNAVVGPPGLPDEVVAKWSATLAALKDDAEWNAGHERIGNIPRVLGRAETTEFMRAQYELYVRLGREASIGAG
ncbi:tripartite tricarboxylate transporter substrate binding protein [Elioraea rosea]|uniref:tripartite tricarboxylate transporter substrate binding protein n=1 Tax=Elioraea rosea TaxID=2492390 RepID=UPI0013158AD3|nr:tripartite tricarboxylate transporter substrate binding protein [Elioraea rosea]